MTDLTASVSLSGIYDLQYDDTTGLLYASTVTTNNDGSGFPLTTGFYAWNPQTGALANPLNFASLGLQGLGALDVTANGQYALLLSGSANVVEKIKLSDYSAQQLFTLSFVDLASTSNGQTIGAGTPGDYVFNAASTTINAVAIPNMAAQFLVKSEDGRFVLGGDQAGRPGSLWIYDSASNSVVSYGVSTTHAFGTADADINSASRMIVYNEYTETNVYDFNFNILHTFAGSNQQYYGAHFSRDGHQLYLFDYGLSKVAVFDTLTWTQVGSVDIGGAAGFQTPGVSTLSGDGRLLVLATATGFAAIDLAARLHLTVTGDATHTLLYGSAVGSDTLTGGAESDRLIGEGGADTYTGGGGVDTFVLTPGAGAAVITDFSYINGDAIDLSRFGTFHSLNDVLAAATQVNNDTVINLGGGGTVTLDNVQKSNLAAGYFDFIPTVKSAGDTAVIEAAQTLNVTSGPLARFNQAGGTLINHGSLIFNSNSYETGIQTYVAPDTAAVFENDGVFSVTAAGATGVLAATTHNYGAFTVTGIGNGAIGSSGNFVNGGTVLVQALGSDNGVSTGNVSALFQNLAGSTFTVSSTASTATGVALGYGGEFDNYGTFTVSSATGGTGLAIGTFAGASVVSNTGTITVTGPAGVGVWAPISSGYAVNLTNSGAITAQTAIQYSAPGAMTNSGHINGAVILSGNDHLLNTGVIDGAVTLGDGDTVNSVNGTITGIINLASGSASVSLGTENNTLVLGTGVHVVDMGGGINTVSYAPAGAGVTVSLAVTSAQNAGVGTDTLTNVQNLTGSAYNDVLEGAGGNNLLDGGAGTNTVSYAHATSGVSVSLALQGQAQNTVGAGTDTLVNFQNLIGSAYSDTLTGSTGTSSLTGGTGADTFKITSGANTAITDFSHAQGDKIDLTAFSQFASLADVLAAATQAGANTVINTGAGSVTLNNVTAANLTDADFALAKPAGPAANFPYDAVCYITDVIAGVAYRASGVIVGPHTILTASHVVFDPTVNQSATSIVISPGYGSGSTVAIPGAAIHYSPFTDSGDLISRAQSQSDFAVIDVAQNLSAYGWFGIDPTFTGGTGGIAGYPGAAGYVQQDTTGALSVDPNYTVIDYSSQFLVSGGSSGGPIWIDKGTSGHSQPYVVGVVSTASWGAEMTPAAVAQLKAWVSQDTGLWVDSPGDMAGSGFDDHLIGTSTNNLIDGKGGNDTFTGGAGADTFVFEAGDGHEVITDFSDAQGDRIDLSAFTGLHSLTQVLAASVQSGANTVITLGGGATVTLNNVAATALNAADFILTPAHGASDFNGDGLGDLLWRNDGGDVGVWLAQNTGSGISFSGQDLGPPSGTWQVQSVGDFNGDGQADILWIDGRGEIGIWTGHAGSTPSFTGQDLGPLPGWHFQATGDVNGDGRADILWRGDNGDLGIWTGQTGSAPSFSGQDFGFVAAAWHVIGTGDFNGDGRADILWTNDNGDVGIWTSQAAAGGGTTFTGQDLGPTPLGWHAQAIGDFDGDGRADILWRNDNGEVGIWQSASTGTSPAFNGRDLGPLTGWTFQDLVDVNGDGRSDIVWRGDNGDVGLWYAQTGPFPSFTGQDFGYVAPSWHIQSQWLV